MLERQIEEILKKRGVSPRALSDEELMQKLGEKMKKVLPLVIDRVMDGIIGEELAKLGRAKRCRYWHKQACTKGIDTCRMDCDAYQPCRWWQQTPGIKAAYATEGFIIGMAVMVGIIAFVSPPLLEPVLYLWLVLVIMSRIHIVYQRRFIRRLTGI